jgi:hypothetical protein
MPLGQLAHMVATMPSWISMIIKQEEVDIKPKDGEPPLSARLAFGLTQDSRGRRPILFWTKAAKQAVLFPVNSGREIEGVD